MLWRRWNVRWRVGVARLLECAAGAVGAAAGAAPSAAFICATVGIASASSLSARAAIDWEEARAAAATRRSAVTRDETATRRREEGGEERWATSSGRRGCMMYGATLCR